MKDEHNFIVVYSCWFASEFLLGRLRRSDETDRRRDDRHSLLIIWVAIMCAMPIVSIIAGTFPMPIVNAPWIRYAGLALIIIGVIMRFWVIRSLGRFFTVDVAIREGHQLKTDGIYSLVRHPSYFASWLSFVGYGFHLNNWISLMVISITMLLAFLNRIRVEEDVLVKQFGDEYLSYRQSTKKIIPGVY
ncbi:isoprenylcysteine carboxylmethyltransferase family protein [Chryseolinea sp. T2]|uniref:methyltransferase family protein n=1 Tax=Chryseolinea sp. T2 TaxID=3129255 RepID=UPI003077E04E